MIKIFSRKRKDILNNPQRAEQIQPVGHIRSRFLAAIVAVLLLNSFHSFAGIFDDEEARKKIDLQQKRLDDLDSKLTNLEATLKGQALLDLMSQIENLRVELNKLRGQLELQTYQIETLQKRQKDLYVDLDERLRRFESSGSVTATGSSATPAADPAAENKTYETAFNFFRTGNYSSAITSFQEFIKSYPSSALAASAQYWIGNAYYATRDYKSAVTAQQKLLSSYPESSKVPDALLNIASSQLELGEKASAKKTLEEIIAKHPASDAADKAKRRLSSIK